VEPEMLLNPAKQTSTIPGRNWSTSATAAANVDYYGEMPSTDVVDLRNNEVLLSLIASAGAGTLNPEDARRFEFKASEALESIAAHPLNGEYAATRLQVGRTHIRLKKVLWDLATNVVLLVIAAHETSGLTGAALAGKAVESLSKLAELIHRLDGREMLVYKAIVDLNSASRSISPTVARATEADIATRLPKDSVSPTELRLTITGLLEKGAIKRIGGAGDQILYAPANILA
jgi:hypothetical protein